MATNFAGDKSSNRRIPRNAKILVATQGFPFTDVADAGVLGLREATTLDFKTITITDRNNRKFTNYRSAQFKAGLLQTDVASLKNLYLLSKEFHQLQVVTKDGDHFPFIDNAAGQDTPDGSALMGMRFKFSMDQKSRKVDADWYTTMSKAEYAWILANIATLNPGTTIVDAESLGLSAANLVYDVTKRGLSNFSKVKVNNNHVGIFKDPKIELDFTGASVDNRDRYLNEVCNIKAEVTLKQTSVTELKAASENGDIDVPIQYETFAGETFLFDPGVLSLVDEVSIGDKENMIKLLFEGSVMYNSDETTPDSIVFGGADPKKIQFKMDAFA